jgi:hypothetical protein
MTMTMEPTPIAWDAAVIPTQSMATEPALAAVIPA